jgi:SAM-dependent MidA family methyltransferase
VADDVERFDHYVERHLYGPDGFYATTGAAGRRRGDFLTSPEVGPLFGAVLGRFLDDVVGRAEVGQPGTVFDVGCGPGTLLRTVEVGVRDRELVDPGEAGRLSGWNLVGVDRVVGRGADRSELPEDLTGSVVVANELLDNLPFRVLERTAEGLAEVHVGPEGEQLVPVGDDGIGFADVPEGHRFPYLEQAREWVASVLARNPLAVVAFDYGAPTTVELAERGGWLRTYRDHQRGHDPLVEPGAWDITTDVAWDQLPAPDRLESQAAFLRRWGIDDLVDQGRHYWAEHAARPDLTALRMRSRVTEAPALVDPAGLGGWWVAIWGPTGV